MDRRQFILSAAAAGVVGPAFASSGVNYTPGLVQQELDAGKTVFIDFYTDWCTTCRVQGTKIRKLLGSNPAYEANITFIKVDYDRHASSQLARRLNIPRRSTLVVLKGDQELGRIVAGTGEKQIKALMDTALAAATA